MKNLEKEILEILLDFEMIFDDNNRVRFCEWIGEEFTFEGSLRKKIKAAGLGDFEKRIKSLKKSGDILIVFDDGAFNISIEKSALSDSILNGIQFD